MFRRLALAGDVSESTWRAEERSVEDSVYEMEWEVGFILGVGVIEVDIRCRFDTGESCVVGIKSLPDLSCTCD